MNDNIQGVFEIKKSWFAKVDSCVFTIHDTYDNKTEVCFDEYDIVKSKQSLAKDKVLKYLKENDVGEITRRELRWIFDGELPESAIKRALIELEKNGDIEGMGNTKNRTFKLIKAIPPED